MGRSYKDRLCIPTLMGIVYIFNSVLFIFGGSLLLTAASVELELHHCISIATDNILMPPHVAMFLGAYIMIVSGTAYLYLFRGRRVPLYVYSALMVLLFMLNLGAGASVVCYRKVWPQALVDSLMHTVNSYDPDTFHIGVDLVQYTFECCGVYNYTDWQRVDRAIPMSCCTSYQECVVSDHNNLFQRGCYDVIAGGLNRNTIELTFLAVVILIYPLIGAVFACVLAHYTRERPKRNTPAVLVN